MISAALISPQMVIRLRAVVEKKKFHKCCIGAEQLFIRALCEILNNLVCLSAPLSSFFIWSQGWYPCLLYSRPHGREVAVRRHAELCQWFDMLIHPRWGVSWPAVHSAESGGTHTHTHTCKYRPRARKAATRVHVGRQAHIITHTRHLFSSGMKKCIRCLCTHAEHSHTHACSTGNGNIVWCFRCFCLNNDYVTDHLTGPKRKKESKCASGRRTERGKEARGKQNEWKEERKWKIPSLNDFSLDPSPKHWWRNHSSAAIPRPVKHLISPRVKMRLQGMRY